jgi:hypothetical protein
METKGNVMFQFQAKTFKELAKLKIMHFTGEYKIKS